METKYPIIHTFPHPYAIEGPYNLITLIVHNNN